MIPKNDLLFGPANKQEKMYWQSQPLQQSSLWIMKRDDDRPLSWPGSNIPNVQRELFLRYTRRGDLILDPFFGGGTTAVVCHEMDRDFIATDLVPMDKFQEDMKQYPWYGGVENWTYHNLSVEDEDYVKLIEEQIHEFGRNHVDFIFWHPPYHDIIPYHQKIGVNKEKDLSSLEYNDFLTAMYNMFLEQAQLLKIGGYAALLIGDKYANGEWVCMGFDVMSQALSCGFRLKATIIKNMADNEAKKGGRGALARQRTTKNGTYIFGHEYVFIFERIS